MKVSAVGTRGHDLSAATLELSGNTAEAVFKLTCGREYTVFAMALWSSGPAVLILGDTGRPDWYHLELFRVTDDRLGANWRFDARNDGGPVLALWGYPSLVSDADHHDALTDRQLDALRVFLGECGDVSGMTAREQLHIRHLEAVAAPT